MSTEKTPLLPSTPASVLITGAAGFLGQALTATFALAGARVRAFDVVPADTAPGVEVVVGDVRSGDDVERACVGCDTMVIAHMAPNRPEIYATPEAPFDINVKGCANLFEQAVRQGMRRVVLISSVAVVDGHLASAAKVGVYLPARPATLYGLTKALQEQIALFHHQKSGIPIAVLRPAYVTDADTLTDKYGRKKPSVNWQFVDRRDVAGAALAAMRAPGLTFATYFVPGHPDAGKHLDLGTMSAEMDWSPIHDFSQWPPDAPN